MDCRQLVCVLSRGVNLIIVRGTFARGDDYPSMRNWREKPVVAEGQIGRPSRGFAVAPTRATPAGWFRQQLVACRRHTRQFTNATQSDDFVILALVQLCATRASQTCTKFRSTSNYIDLTIVTQ